MSENDKPATPSAANERCDWRALRAALRRRQPARPKVPKRPKRTLMQERMETAWRLALYSPDWSKARVVEATGAAEGTVAEQRRVLQALQQQWMDAGPHADLPNPMAMTWAEARAAARGLK